VIVERELHPLRQYSQIFSTEGGIQIDESDEQSENAQRSIHESLELDSNVIVERDLHSLKQYSQIFSTEEGIQIDESDEQLENARHSIHNRLEPLSNITVEILCCSAKQPALNFRILFPIVTSDIFPK
jgi:hypothetical protein